MVDAAADEHIEIPGGKVVEVIRRAAPLPTLLISDETDGDVMVRRLRFFQLDTCDEGHLVSDHIQSEMLLGCDGRVNAGCLRQHYHGLMVAALGLVAVPARIRCGFVLGHGAGALSSFLAEVLGSTITAVDCDAGVVKAGQKHFGDSACVHVSDAAAFVLQSSGLCVDAVLIDVNAVLEPLDAPPACLFSPQVVRALARATPLLVVNVLGGDEADRCRVSTAFSDEFQNVMWLRSALCSNHILVAANVPLVAAPSQEHLDGWIAMQRKMKALALALAPLRVGTTILHELHHPQQEHPSRGISGRKQRQQSTGGARGITGPFVACQVQCGGGAEEKRRKKSPKRGYHVRPHAIVRALLKKSPTKIGLFYKRIIEPDALHRHHTKNFGCAEISRTKIWRKKSFVKNLDHTRASIASSKNCMAHALYRLY